MPLKLKEIFLICADAKELIHWLIGLSVLINLEGKTCGNCDNGKFGFRRDSSYSSDGFVWRCSNKSCNKKISIRFQLELVAGSRNINQLWKKFS